MSYRLPVQAAGPLVQLLQLRNVARLLRTRTLDAQGPTNGRQPEP